MVFVHYSFSSLNKSFPHIVILTLFVHLPLKIIAQTSWERAAIVEQVTKNSEGERAGLRPGDKILAWSRSTAHGVIESPFDVDQIEAEQNPRGSLLLEGLSGQEKRIWKMGPGAWGLVLRPSMAQFLLSEYDEVQKLAQTGHWDSSGELLHSLAQRVQPFAPAWLRPWLLSREAEYRARAKQWKDADAAYTDAIQLAARAEPRIAAQLLRSQGDTFLARSQWDKAEDCYRRALNEIEKTSGADLAVAAILTNLGRVAFNRGDSATSGKFHSQALALREQIIPESLDVARSLNNLGTVAWDQGDMTKAEGYHRKAIAIKQNLVPGSLELAASLSNLGVVFMERGEFAQAEDYYIQALAIRQRLAPNTLDVEISFNNLGNLSRERGDLSKAEEYFENALAIQERLAPDSLGIATILNNIGLVLSDRGDLAKAEEYQIKALAIRKKLAPNSIAVAASLSNLAGVAKDRGDLPTAEEYYRQSHAIKQKLAPNSIQVANALNNLGTVAEDSGDFEKADRYYREALALKQRLAPDSITVAISLENVGNVARRRGHLAEAEKCYRQALEIDETLAPDSLDVAGNLENLAEAAVQRGESEKAEALFRQALPIREKLAPEHVRYAETLYNLGSILLKHGRRDEALGFLERAIKSLEIQSTRLGGTEEVRSRFRAEYNSYYLRYIAVLLESRQPERAIHVLERSRARSLLGMLAERDLVFSSDLPISILRERKLNAAAFDRIQAQISELNPRKQADEIERQLFRLRELGAERERIVERIKRASPHYAALQYPQPLELEGIRRSLDPGTVMLSYSVSPDTTHLFVVRPGGTTPGIAVYAIPVAETTLRGHVKQFRALIEEFPRLDSGKLPANRTAVLNKARELYNLLVKPAEAQLVDAERLLIVPDGPLHTLPFSALARNDRQYLIEWKPLHTIVSATVYSEIKRVWNELRRPSMELVAFGNPLYPKAERKAAPGRGVDSEEPSNNERRFNFVDLPFSKNEIEDVGALYPQQKQIYLGPDATEESAKSASPNGRYIHFAVHGFLDERFPLNSGLALTIPEKRVGRENGLLQAWEIFEQVRLQADLVVLSACQTGLGKEMGGEGLIGLTRAFQYAGARSILASLWNVDDLKTAGLMKLFYTALKQDKSKDQALREAQMELLHKRPASHPYFWAPFSLIGYWR